MYSCEEEYNEQASAQAEQEAMCEQASEINQEIERLEAEKEEIQGRIDDLINDLNKI